MDNKVKWQLVLPKSQILDVLRELHNNSTQGYFGEMLTVQRIREQFYWNKSKEGVEK